MRHCISIYTHTHTHQGYTGEIGYYKLTYTLSDAYTCVYCKWLSVSMCESMTKTRCSMGRGFCEAQGWILRVLTMTLASTGAWNGQGIYSRIYTSLHHHLRPPSHLVQCFKTSSLTPHIARTTYNQMYTHIIRAAYMGVRTHTHRVKYKGWNNSDKSQHCLPTTKYVVSWWNM